MGLKTCISFVHDRVRRGVGLLRHNLLCMHVYKELMQCKSVCDIKSGIDPLPFWLGREQKLLGFLKVLKHIKWQDLLEGGKNGRNAFRTGAKIHFSEKKIWGVRGTLRFQIYCEPGCLWHIFIQVSLQTLLPHPLLEVLYVLLVMRYLYIVIFYNLITK